jgi:hypothetical protein
LVFAHSFAHYRSALLLGIDNGNAAKFPGAFFLHKFNQRTKTDLTPMNVAPMSGTRLCGPLSEGTEAGPIFQRCQIRQSKIFDRVDAGVLSR